MRPGLLLLFTAIALHSQTPLITGDALACFAARLDKPAGNASTSALVAISGQSFTQALDVQTIGYSTALNPWDIRPRCFQTTAAQQNDTILATFWMRTISGPNGSGSATIVAERNGSPYTKSVTFTASAGAQWQQFSIPFAMAETYTTGGNGSDGFNMSFWVSAPDQEIQLGGIAFLDYGPNVPFSSLPLSSWPYAGFGDPNAPWIAAAQARIEKIRKNDVAIVVRDAAGNLVPNAPVHLKMLRHAFGFGTAVAGDPIRNTGTDGQNYRAELAKLFNKIVPENGLKWVPFEQGWGQQDTDSILAWVAGSDIQQVRGHNVVWPSKTYLPQDVIDMLNASPIDVNALRSRVNTHIGSIMNYVKGRVTEWDVINEPVANHDLQDALGPNEMAAWMTLARQTDPNIKLYVNDYNILEAGGADLTHINAFKTILQNLIAQGAPLDGIGLQSHFDSNLTPPTRVLQLLDQFGAMGKDLQITEYDVIAGDENIQAQFTREFLTACFSHAAVKGFMNWGFWAGAHWRPAAAFIHQDWTHAPAYDVWTDLVLNEWWTDVSGATGPDGVFRTRGFLGDYTADVTLPTGAQQLTLSITQQSGPTYASTSSSSPAPAINAIVNAASFGNGPVAPGEIVTLFGTGFGPAALAPVTADDTGKLMSWTGDTRVYFDGMAAPMIYALNGQVSAIVPYAATGHTSVQVEYLGVKSAPLTLTVSSAAPGVFCYSGGAGRAVIVNAADGSINSAAQPAARGSYITLFLTGAGATKPATLDGIAYTTAFPAPLLPVAVTIGGKVSACSSNFVGSTYAGVTQINACVPTDAPIGDAVPLQILIGGIASQAGVTVAVR